MSPGVESAAVSTYVPLAGGGERGRLDVEGRAVAPDAHESMRLVGATSTIFETLGVHLVRGRLLTPAESLSRANIAVVNEEESQVYTAIVGDTAVGGVTYSRVGDRLVLQAAAVYPEFRGQGIATEMIRQVLNDVRSHGEKVTNLCPLVRTFVDKHPQYEDVIDPKNPGVVSRRRS